jgi:hypothetical protein
MAHFAWLNDDNIVTFVSVVNNVDLLDNDGNESEAVGIVYLTSVHGEGKVWKQTSYNGNFRGTYAGIGYTYDATNDVFIPQGWTYDAATDTFTPPEITEIVTETESGTPDGNA